MAKKQYQRDTGEKIFEILLNRFGSGVQGHQAMMRFEKRRQREDKTIDKFLDDLEMLRMRSQPVESNRGMNLVVASKFIDGPRHEEALSGVKASKARLLSEAEARRKEKLQELAKKKMQAVTEEMREPEPVTAAVDFKIDYRAAARDALSRVQQELVTKEIEQKVKLDLENEKIQERPNALEASEVEETKAPSSMSMKLNVISGQTFGMMPQGSRIQSIISVAGHQVIRHLNEPSKFTMMLLDTYADYLRQVEPRTESRAVRALLTTGGPRTKKLHWRYVEVYGRIK